MASQKFAFSKSRRLILPAEFESVRKNGKVQRGKLMMLSVLAVEQEKTFRAGFVTSRKIGNAVVRNRVRRRLREIVRKHQHEIVNGRWIVTIARVNSGAGAYRELEDEWLRLARRASILAP
jgi:ribonuclease P protein component